MTTLERDTITPARPAYAAQAAVVVAAPLRPGERVMILVGGYLNDTGRILSVTPDYAGREPRISIYLSSGVTVMGYRPSQLQRAGQ